MYTAVFYSTINYITVPLLQYNTILGLYSSLYYYNVMFGGSFQLMNVLSVVIIYL